MYLFHWINIRLVTYSILLFLLHYLPSIIIYPRLAVDITTSLLQSANQYTLKKIISK